MYGFETFEKRVAQGMSFRTAFLAAILGLMFLCPTFVYSQVSWLVQITDTHLGQSKSYEPDDKALWTDAVKAIVHDCNKVIRPAVVVNTGDLVSVGAVEDFTVYNDVICNLHAPLLNCPGNHDYERDKAIFLHSIGPSHQQLLIGDMYFVCMNTLSFMGSHTDTTEFSFLKAALVSPSSKNARIRIVCGHYPIYTDEERHIGGIHMRKNFQIMGSNRATLMQALRIGQADLYLSGHVHANWDQVCLVSDTRHLVTDCTASGSYRVIVVDGTSVGTRITTTNKWPLIVVTQPTAYVKGSSSLTRGEFKVRTKVFAKSEVNRVSCIIDEDHAGSLKLVDDDMWETKFNASEMKPGLHLLSVEATDAEGNSSISEISFVVHK